MFLLFHFWCAHTLSHTHARSRRCGFARIVPTRCPFKQTWQFGRTAANQLAQRLAKWSETYESEFSGLAHARGLLLSAGVCVLMGAVRPEQGRATCQGSPTTNRNTSRPQRFSPVSGVEAPCECSSIQWLAHVRNSTCGGFLTPHEALLRPGLLK